MNAPKCIGTVGDVDPTNDGGIILDHGDGEPTLDYFVCQNDEENDDDKRVYLRYRACLSDLETDVRTARNRNGWIRPGDVARSCGYTTRDYIRSCRSTDPRVKAYAIVDAAGYYGWENFDSYPVQCSADEVTAFVEQFEEPKRCDSCASVTINGVFCHETGCPKTPKTCRECGNPDPDGTCCAPADDDQSTGCGECVSNGLTHVSYPHEPGYLIDCEACEDHCHCSDASGKRIEGRAACVFSECSDEDEDHDEHDTDGPDDGCSVCEAMGACPSCHSLSPGRCGCNDDETEDAE